MSGFSFTTTAGASQSTAKPRLEGNKIHTVKLESVEIDDFQGVKDTSQTYRVLKFNFSNEDGHYPHTIFEPKPDDFDRGESEYTDKTGKVNKIPQPSNFETMMLFVKHTMDSFAPAIAAQIDAGKKEIAAPDWDTFRKLVKKIFESDKTRETKVKLIKNKKGEGIFPGFFSAVNRDGVAYVRNNFIGEKVAFTAYEMKKIQDEANAAPSQMQNSAADLEVDNTDINDVDVNLDLGDL